VIRFFFHFSENLLNFLKNRGKIMDGINTGELVFAG